MTTTEGERAMKPVPEIDDLNRPFFEGSARGALMVRRCRTCRAFLSPVVEETCTECLGEDLDWVEASGRATLHTFGIMHQRYHPAFEADLPYNIAIVELAEGPRLQTNIVGVANDALRVGMALEVTFEEMAPGRFMPKFRPAP